MVNTHIKQTNQKADSVARVWNLSAPVVGWVVETGALEALRLLACQELTRDPASDESAGEAVL